MNTKTPPNTAAINSLKQQGFSVKIKHFRRKKWKDKLEPLITDKTIRKLKNSFPEFGYHLFSECGGATELELNRGEEIIKVRADCYVKDHFSKRQGVKTCLDRLKNLHNIEA